MAVLATLADPGRSLCWVAPVAEESELAAEDPLALDYIAQQVGLLLLPALTTRSTRAQAFRDGAVWALAGGAGDRHV